MAISCSVLLRMRNVSDKSCRENQNTHFMSNNISRKYCHLWDIVEKCGRARQVTHGNIIRRMCFVCWIKRATNTHSEYVILIVFFYCNNNCTNAPRCYVYTYISYLVFCLSLWPSIRRNRLTDFYEIQHERAYKSFVRFGSVTVTFLLKDVHEFLPVLSIVLSKFGWNVL